MRIRKRQVPLPLSSLSPVPLSDPHLLNCSSSPPLVQPPPPQQHDPKPSQRLHHVGPLPPQPSDHPNRRLIGPSSNDGSGSDFSCELMKTRNYCAETLKGEDEDGSRDEGEKKGKDTRKGSILGAETVSSAFPSQSSCSSHRVLEKWFEGEKAFPFKKRRGSIGEATRVEKEKKLTQTKMEKKSDVQQSDGKKQEDRAVTREGIDQNVGSGTSPKKRARGNAIMEGSRCSRVNGRGWRCCQQTLVGYSLCEHHLGKGRLRSLNSVRSRSLASSIGSIESKSKQLPRESNLELPKDEERKPDMILDVNHHGEDQRHESVDSEEKKALVVTKKRMKLGTVKARSMSSLLGQTNCATAADDENNK